MVSPLDRVYYISLQYFPSCFKHNFVMVTRVKVMQYLIINSASYWKLVISAALCRWKIPAHKIIQQISSCMSLAVGGGGTGDIMQGGAVKFCSECSIFSGRLHRLMLLLRSCTALRPPRGTRLSCRGLVRFCSSALELDTMTLWKSWVPLTGKAFLQGDTFHNSTKQLLNHS